MIRAVLFDIDGTLIDSVDRHAAAWVAALSRFGFVVEQAAVRAQIGKGADQLLPVFLPADIVEAKGDDITEFRSELFKREHLPALRPFPGVAALFRRVRDAGLSIALASSAKADEIDRYAEIAGITGLFDAALSADDAERSKPHGDIFAAALARLAPILPDEALVVGDTAWDAIAAGEVGVRTIGFLCGGVGEVELRRAGAVAIYDGPADLLARFDGSPLAR